MVSAKEMINLYPREMSSPILLLFAKIHGLVATGVTRDPAAPKLPLWQYSTPNISYNITRNLAIYHGNSTSC